MNLMVRLSLLSLVLVSASHAQTLVQFSPASGYSHGLPVAAGFAYAFHAPVSAAKSFDSLIGSPVSQTYQEVPVYHAAPAKKTTIVKKPIVAKKNIIVPSVLKTQYHSQDELGQYAYGYVHNDASHHEERTADGGVTGSYSYYDQLGNKQSANYRADKNGYRVQSTNLPQNVLLPVEQTPEVLAATQAHLQAVQNAKARSLFGHGPFSGIGDTPEVAAAKAAHLKAYNEIKRRHSHRHRRSAHRPHSYRQSYHQSQASYAAPPVPVRPTLAVQQATYEHLKAKQAVHKYGGSVHVGIQDTPAVAAARDAHNYAYNKIAQDHARRWKRSAWNTYSGAQPQGVAYKDDGISQRFDDGSYRHQGEETYFDDGSYKQPQQYNNPQPSSYHAQTSHQQSPSYNSHQYNQQPAAPYVPVIPGVPTPEVQAATQAHLQAVHETHTYGTHAHQGVQDTPEVAAAKNAHLHTFHHIAKDHAKRWKRSTWGSYGTGAQQQGTPYGHDDGLYRDDGLAQQFDDGRYRHQGEETYFDDGSYKGDQQYNNVQPTSYQAGSQAVHQQFSGAQPNTYNNGGPRIAPVHSQPANTYQFKQHSVGDFVIPGVPTPEVQAATQAHLQAVHETHTYGTHAHQGVQDTPEVAHAKNAHLNTFHHIAQDHARRWKRSPHYSPVAHVHQTAYSGTPVVSAPEPAIIKQYHAQDETGQYNFGFSGGPSARHEEKGIDGVTRGFYSYVDAYGILQKVEYEADDYTGFKIVSATNVP